MVTDGKIYKVWNISEVMERAYTIYHENSGTIRSWEIVDYLKNEKNLSIDRLGRNHFYNFPEEGFAMALDETERVGNVTKILVSARNEEDHERIKNYLIDSIDSLSKKEARLEKALGISRNAKPLGAI